MGFQLRARGLLLLSERILLMTSKDLLVSTYYTPQQSPWQILFSFMDSAVDQGRHGARRLILIITGLKNGFPGMRDSKLVASTVLDTWQIGTIRKTASLPSLILPIHCWVKSETAPRSEKLMLHLRVHDS